MRLTFAVGLNTGCLAAVLFLGNLQAAEQRPPTPLGLSREEVLVRNGEPKSQMAAGGREILFFARERIVLRNGVVIEVEPLAAEAPRKAPPAAPGQPPAAEVKGPAPSSAPTETSRSPEGAPANPLAVPAAPDSSVEIKLVRPPSSGSSPSSAKTESSSVPTPPVTTPDSTPRAASIPRPPSRPVTENPPAFPRSPTDSEISNVVPSLVTPPAPVSRPDDPVLTPAVTSTDGSLSKEKKATSVPATKSVSVPAKPPTPRPSQAAPEAESGFSPSSFVIGLAVLAAGIGFFAWRLYQRKLALAASAVSVAPFSVGNADGASALFTPEALARLEWKQFEELVAAYYSKTGVVAVRTKAGPSAPVHIRISWKGEPRPFACVQCIAHPPGLIESRPIEELCAVLTAEDIRRGYVVTTGKFSLPARDFAEEKHVTLLSGDLLLEKLNALPEGPRSELIEEIFAGDFTTPSCPRCEAKMVRVSGEPHTWRCSTHPEVKIVAPV